MCPNAKPFVIDDAGQVDRAELLALAGRAGNTSDDDAWQCVARTRDSAAALVGGFVGNINDAWLTIELLWSRGSEPELDELLLAHVEARARAAGLIGLRVHTTAAPATWQQRGFRVVGVIAEYSPGLAQVTLVKRLDGDRSVDDGGVHPPKRESYDPLARTNTDPKGVVRRADEVRETPFGLYCARPADHPAFWYLQQWVLPDLGLRATLFHFRSGHERDQRAYLDVGDYRRAPDGTFSCVDWYLDLVEHPGAAVELLDTDELLAARVAGVLSAVDADRAVQIAHRAAVGVASHGGSVDAWLASVGAPITWPTVAPRP